MKTKNEVLTEREKIVIAGAVVLALMGEKIPAIRAYQYSHDTGNQGRRTIETATAKFNADIKVNDFREEVRQAIQEEGRKSLTEYERRKARKEGKEIETDFTNREEFIQFLNSTANQITNEKDKRDYLKMIADLLRLKEDTTDKNGEIMKFYTPVTCSSCPIKAEFNKIRSQKSQIQK